MKRPARIAAICLTVGGGAVTLLLWAKLKLVAGIPRTVYAEPQANDSEAHPSADNAEFVPTVEVESEKTPSDLDSSTQPNK